MEVQASGRILFREVMARNADRMAVAWQFGLLIGNYDLKMSLFDPFPRKDTYIQYSFYPVLSEFNNHLWRMETDNDGSGLASTQPKWICKLMG